MATPTIDNYLKTLSTTLHGLCCFASGRINSRSCGISCHNHGLHIAQDILGYFRLDISLFGTLRWVQKSKTKNETWDLKRSINVRHNAISHGFARISWFYEGWLERGESSPPKKQRGISCSQHTGSLPAARYQIIVVPASGHWLSTVHNRIATIELWSCGDEIHESIFGVVFLVSTQHSLPMAVWQQTADSSAVTHCWLCEHLMDHMYQSSIPL